MQEIVKTRSCQIQLDEQNQPTLCTADGVYLADPTFPVFAGLPPAVLTFVAQSPLHFVEPFIVWQDDASPVRIPIDKPPSIIYGLDSNGTLVITVTPPENLQAELIYHFTMFLADDDNNTYEVGTGANAPASGDGTEYGVDPTIVENPPIGGDCGQG